MKLISCFIYLQIKISLLFFVPFISSMLWGYVVWMLFSHVVPSNNIIIKSNEENWTRSTKKFQYYFPCFSPVENVSVCFSELQSEKKTFQWNLNLSLREISCLPLRTLYYFFIILVSTLITDRYRKTHLLDTNKNFVQNL